MIDQRKLWPDEEGTEEPQLPLVWAIALGLVIGLVVYTLMVAAA